MVDMCLHIITQVKSKSAYLFIFNHACILKRWPCILPLLKSAKVLYQVESDFPCKSTLEIGLEIVLKLSKKDWVRDVSLKLSKDLW